MKKFTLDIPAVGECAAQFAQMFPQGIDGTLPECKTLADMGIAVWTAQMFASPSAFDTFNVKLDGELLLSDALNTGLCDAFDAINRCITEDGEGWAGETVDAARPGRQLIQKIYLSRVGRHLHDALNMEV